jgi:hypothetical protein
MKKRDPIIIFPKIQFKMKTISIFFTLAIFTFLASSCNKCNNDDPTARILNKGTGSAEIQITAANGNIVQISDLSTGSISSSKEYAPGNTTVKYTIGSLEKTEVIALSSCTDYDISINSDNKLVIFSQEKD